ncbi:MAG TPA: hypothetical protein VGD66_16035 [Allosphingosinicella sp.]
MVDLFLAACTQGEVRLPAGTARVTNWSKLPPPIRDWAEGSGAKGDATYVIIERPATGYLIIANYEPKRSGGVKSRCTLLSTALDYEPAVRRLLPPSQAARLPIGPRQRSMETTMEIGYRLSARKLGRNLVMLQSTIFDDATAARLAEQGEARRSGRQ